MRKISTVFLLLAIIAAALPAHAAKKSSAPVFEPNGRISGTELMYENLSINSSGVVAVTIYNPTGRGISFDATFSFFNAKGEYLMSFKIGGFSHKNDRATYVEEIDYASVKGARSVKVLGRSGRVSE